MNISMECSCVCNVNEYNGPEAFSVSYPRANKPHICCECKETIPVGAQYERVWGIWESDMDTFKTCAICVRIRNDYCCSYAFGCLRVDLWNALGVDYVTGEIKEDLP